MRFFYRSYFSFRSKLYPSDRCVVSRTNRSARRTNQDLNVTNCLVASDRGVWHSSSVNGPSFSRRASSEGTTGSLASSVTLKPYSPCAAERSVVGHGRFTPYTSGSFNGITFKCNKYPTSAPDPIICSRRFGLSPQIV